MSDQCQTCHGTGKLRNLRTLSPSDDEVCSNCSGSGNAPYTHACCNQCGWTGERGAMKDDDSRPMDELCPECNSTDTEWLTEAEAQEERD